eukprot:scaffold268039_cov44-Prasinocladus_malaysianus.AAC.1
MGHGSPMRRRSRSPESVSDYSEHEDRQVEIKDQQDPNAPDEQQYRYHRRGRADAEDVSMWGREGEPG